MRIAYTPSNLPTLTLRNFLILIPNLHSSFTTPKRSPTNLSQRKSKHNWPNFPKNFASREKSLAIRLQTCRLSTLILLLFLLQVDTPKIASSASTKCTLTTFYGKPNDNSCTTSCENKN